MAELPAAVADEIAALALKPGEPLIVTDADEVLFLFIDGFKAYLVEQGYWLDLTSFKLFGNIKRSGSGELAPVEEATALLAGFFEERTEFLTPVTGAAAALAGLAVRARIVVLSNLPHGARAARERALAKAGMPYPLIVNSGVKGPAVQALAAATGGAPVFFLDDIPRNIQSVAEAVPAAICIHFVADPQLAGLVEPAEHCTHRIDDWAAVHELIAGQLPVQGYR